MWDRTLITNGGDCGGAVNGAVGGGRDSCKVWEDVFHLGEVGGVDVVVETDQRWRCGRVGRPYLFFLYNIRVN